MIKPCLFCGKDFKTISNHQRYCLECKVDAYRKKYRDQSRKYREEHPEYKEWKRNWGIEYNKKEEVKKRKNKWAKENTGVLLAWREKNPEKVKSIRHKIDSVRLGYTEEFSYELKQKVKERDGYECQLCGEHEKALVVHHKDKTKTNNDINNLITLCRACHIKTHGPS